MTKQTSNISESKLVILLQSLKKEEFKLLKKFLNSPFHNTNKSLLKFYDYLATVYPDFNPKKKEKLEYKYIYFALFPERSKSYQSQKMIKFMSEFVSKIETFLINLELKKAPSDFIFDRNLHLLNIFQKRGLHQYFSLKVRQINEQMESKTMKNAKDFFMLHYVNEYTFYCPYTPKFQPKIDSLNASIDHLNAFNQLQQLKYECELATRNHLLRHQRFVLQDTSNSNKALTFNDLNSLVTIYKKMLRLTKGDKMTHSFLSLNLFYIHPNLLFPIPT